MKYECELIQDLLPLYEEGLCSPSSRAAVEEHITECPDCRRLTGSLPQLEPPAQVPQADRAVKKGIKKVRRRWLTSLIAAMLIVPVLLLSVNQFLGRGICFTNVDDYFAARRFLSALENQDWETAAGMGDFSGDYKSILEALSEPVSSWGACFTSVSIDGNAYRQTIAAGQYKLGSAADIFGFLYNRQGRVFLDLDLWEQVCAVEPDAVEQSGTRYTINLVDYLRFETPWGEFVGNMDTDTGSAYSICLTTDLLPEQLWQEAESAIAQDAQAIYNATHQAYGHVSAMTEQEFQTYMEQKYAAELSALAEQGIGLACTGFQDAYSQPEAGGWVIRFGVRVTHGTRSEEITVDILVDSGHAGYHGLSRPAQEDTLWLDDLSAVLYPSAHPDY